PAQPVALVFPQLPAEPPRRLGGGYPFECAQAPARLFKDLVARGGRFGGQQGVQQPGLAAVEAEVVSLACPQPGQDAVFPEPLFRQDAYAAVVETDGVFLSLECRQESRQRCGTVTEFDRSAQLEPVDSRADF